MKTERVVLLVTADFKQALERKAREKGVSLSEYIRGRCDGPGAPQDLVELGEVVAELRREVARGKGAISAKLDAVQAVLEKMGTKLRRSKQSSRTT
jgi:hypothetical protein